VKLQSWWWRDLCKSYGEGEELGWFHGALGWKVGSGDKVRFWEDTWNGSSPLKVVYPRLFSLSLNQGQKVPEVGVWEDDVWHWTFRWIRARFQWESEQKDDLLRSLARVKLSREVTDNQVWE